MKDKLFNPENLPIDIPSETEAWKDLLVRLDNHMPEPPAPSTALPALKEALYSLSRIALLISVICLTWFPLKDPIKMTYGSLATLNNRTAEPLKKNGIPRKSAEAEFNHQKGLTEHPISIGQVLRQGPFKHLSPKGRIPKHNPENRSTVSKTESATLEIAGSTQTLEEQNDVTAKNEKQAITGKSGPKKADDGKRQKEEQDPQDNKKEDAEESQALLLGVQWVLQAPFHHQNLFFTGPSGKFQPQLSILPGAWLHLVTGRSMVDLAFNPYISSLLPSGQYSTDASTRVNGDSTIQILSTKSITKIFGYSATLGYQIRFFRNWWAGGGFQANWWTHGLANYQSNEEIQLSNNPSAKIMESSHSTVSMNDGDWENFARFQLNLYGELDWRKKREEAGLRINIPFTPLSKNDDHYNPVRTELFFRLVLVRKPFKF